MGKIIAIWGCPASGKTTLCIKLAKAIYDRYAAKILCVFGDTVIPSLPLLFPLDKEETMHSLGGLLADVEITPDSLLRYMVTTNEAKDIGFLGYRGGENRHTYPTHTVEKAAGMLEIAASMADFVLVDAGWYLTAPLAEAAVHNAATIFKVIRPGLPGIGFLNSQEALYNDPRYRLQDHQTILNVPHTGYLPVEETAQALGIQTIIPYAWEVEKQMMEGRLLHRVQSGPYNKTVRQLAETVVQC